MAKIAKEHIYTQTKRCVCTACAVPLMIIDDGIHCTATLVLNHGVALHVSVHNADCACGNPMAQHQS